MRTSTTRHRACARRWPLGLPALCTWVLLFPGPAAASATLHDGSRGPRVAAVQKALHQRVDRIFGAATGRAVERLQRRHGLDADGVVGPRTWALVKRLRARQRARAPQTRSARRGGLPLRVRRIIAAADRIAGMPYRYGGGHGNWRDSGYDCSGSVSFALHGAGLLRTALDSGRFMGWGAPGPGRWVTVYAKPSHAYMVVRGRRFDTSGSGATRWQADLRTDGGYVARHPPGL